MINSSTAHAKGAKKPAQLQTPPQRQLKKLITLDEISAHSVLVEKNSLELSPLLEKQMLAQLAASKRFAIKQKKKMPSLPPPPSNPDDFLPFGFDDSPQDPRICLPEDAPLRLSGELLEFVLETSSGYQIGYQSGGFLGPAVSGNVHIKKSRMTGVFEVYDHKGEFLVASQQSVSKQDEKIYKASFNFASILLGYDYFQKTPLSVATSNLLVQALNGINQELDKYPWEGMIVAEDFASNQEQDAPQYVALNAGVDAAIKVGDVFELRNAEHYWKGVPCQSEYDRARVERSPVALAEVVEVAAGYSWLEVLPNSSNKRVKIGAKASVNKLVK